MFNEHRMFNKHRMHGMAIFKIFTDVEIKVDINVAEEFNSHFTESTLLYYNTEAFLTACILAHIFSVRLIDQSLHNINISKNVERTGRGGGNTRVAACQVTNLIQQKQKSHPHEGQTDSVRGTISAFT
jgi:hypothetical protein